MSVTTSSTESKPPAVIRRPNMVSVGTIVWLASELMFFAALFAMYFTLRSVHPEVWKVETGLLNVKFAFFNTLVLVASSFTCQAGVFSAEKGGAKQWGLHFRQWYVLTIIMGAFFVGGQAYEYAELAHKGLTLGNSVYGSAFFLTTGFHALHVTGGLVAFLFVLGRTYMRPKLNHQMVNSAIVTSYYWHFVDVVWIGLFSIIYFLK